MSIVIKGYDGVTQQPARKRRSGQGKGWVTVLTWKGPKAKINALKYDPQLAQAEDLDVIEGGHNAQLTATFPFDNDAPGAEKTQELNVAWECHPQEMEKDLRTHPRFASVLAEIAKADKYIDAGRASEVTLANGWTQETINYVTLRLKGVTGYPEEYYVLTKTTKCGSASAVKAAQVAERTVVSVTSLGLPSGAKFTIPESYQARCCKPDVTQVPNGWHIVQRWVVMESWSALLYTGGTGTP